MQATREISLYKNFQPLRTALLAALPEIPAGVHAVIGDYAFHVAEFVPEAIKEIYDRDIKPFETGQRHRNSTQSNLRPMTHEENQAVINAAAYIADICFMSLQYDEPCEITRGLDRLEPHQQTNLFCLWRDLTVKQINTKNKQEVDLPCVALSYYFAHPFRLEYPYRNNRLIRSYDEKKGLTTAINTFKDEFHPEIKAIKAALPALQELKGHERHIITEAAEAAALLEWEGPYVHLINVLRIKLSVHRYKYDIGLEIIKLPSLHHLNLADYTLDEHELKLPPSTNLQQATILLDIKDLETLDLTNAYTKGATINLARTTEQDIIDWDLDQKKVDQLKSKEVSLSIPEVK